MQNRHLNSGHFSKSENTIKYYSLIFKHKNHSSAKPAIDKTGVIFTPLNQVNRNRSCQIRIKKMGKPLSSLLKILLSFHWLKACSLPKDFVLNPPNRKKKLLPKMGYFKSKVEIHTLLCECLVCKGVFVLF